MYQRPYFSFQKVYILIAVLLAHQTAFANPIAKPVQVFAVVVGIREYKQSDANLQYADQDAQNIFDFLTDRNYGNVPPANITLLVNKNATKQNILKAIAAQFSRASANDIVLFYFSGHGNPGVLCPYDQAYSKSTALWYDEIKNGMNTSAANRKICFLDACFSGSIVDKNMGKKSFDAEFVSMQQQLARFSDVKQADKGSSTSKIFVYASSRKNQTSAESDQLKEGVFTYYLLKGLKGEADGNHNSVITAGELLGYLKKQINTQSPVLAGLNIDNNMIIFSINRPH